MYYTLNVIKDLIAEAESTSETFSQFILDCIVQHPRRQSHLHATVRIWNLSSNFSKATDLFDIITWYFSLFIYESCKQAFLWAI